MKLRKTKYNSLTITNKVNLQRLIHGSRVIVFGTLFMFSSLSLFADDPPPAPPPGCPPDDSKNTIGGQGQDAPIGNGVYVLLAMGAIYMGRKIYKIKLEASQEIK